MNSRVNYKFTRWLALWAALVTGHLAAILVFPGVKVFCEQSFADMLGVVLLPLSAVVYAAVVPLSIISFTLFLFRVRGGTLTAIISLLLGSMLIYPALIWFLRIWLRTEKLLVRRLGWLVLLSYAVLATYCLMYVSSRMKASPLCSNNGYEIIFVTECREYLLPELDFFQWPSVCASREKSHYPYDSCYKTLAAKNLPV